MAAATRHGPRTVGRLLPPDLRRAFRTRGFAESAILTEWAAVVGEQLATHTCPERLGRDGTLRIRVTSGAALELQHSAPQILERIATFFGYRAVARLTLVQGPVKAARRRGPATPPPLAPESEDYLGQATQAVEDAELREALHRLGRSVLATKKPP